MKKEMIGPKWVDKARSWCVTIFIDGKQEIKWFNSKEEAERFIETSKNS